MYRFPSWLVFAAIVGTLAGCARAPLAPPSPSTPPALPEPPAREVSAPTDAAPASVLQQPRSRWVPVAWDALPGWHEDALHDAWQAWLRGCERPVPAFQSLCRQVRPLSIADEATQRAWLMTHLQPYRVESTQGEAQGLLTAYYEPVLQAARRPDAEFRYPLYQAPAGLAARQPWFSRQEIETQPQAQAALRGREIAWLRDPVDALILHIQGSGRLWINEADGSRRLVRLAFAGTNGHPYQSVGRWLLDQGLVRDASWPGIKAWLAANPRRTQELLWSNPRYVFFREEALPAAEAGNGPRGAQGVPLTPGRSIAVDPLSIPYGTPVWLASSGPTVALNRLVLAQDTGSAIVGAVRADFFVGWDEGAGELAGRLKQPLRLWALWPRQ